MKIWLIFTIILVPLTFKGNAIENVIPTTKTTPAQFNLSFKGLSKMQRLELVTPILKDIASKTCIPDYIFISFWIEETGYGTSRVFLENKNWGGVRRKNKYVEYSSFEEGLYEWAKVLSKQRYAKNFPTDTTDIYGWVDAYHNGGYWEGVKEWRNNRINLINKYKLCQN